ncbi:MAG: benzoate-CoA ligase family protein [Candidatus Eremiobacteraeota bacterium]|nr:benzoate-CoA ligase family protein [Candidatus Eremiobacteraeota bacterium]
MAAVAHVPESFNAAQYFVDRNVEQGRAGKVAVEFGERRLTYGDVLAGVNRCANALGSLGLGLEQRVTILLPDCPDFISCFFGAMKLGAIAVPTNTLLKPHDYRYMLEDSRARVLVVSTALWPSVAPIVGELHHLSVVAIVDDARTGMPAGAPVALVDFHQVLAAASPEFTAYATSKDDAAFWLYSSGTTGFPKGTIHLHHDMAFCCETFGKHVLGINESDRTFSVAKLFFAYGLGNALYFPFGVGATTILHPGRPLPEVVLGLAATSKPTIFYAVPTAYAAMLDVADGPARFDLSSVRLGVSAGEALPADIYRRWKAAFGFDIIDGIGSTEAAHMFISNRPGAIKPGSSGQIVEGYDARIVDADGNDVPVGATGRLQIAGDSIAAGYWNRHEKTKATFLGEWLDTGDTYRLDEDGYYWYAGRSDDMLKVGGQWVSPVEVESTLIEHPAVLEAGVVGVADEHDLIKPVAYVVLRRGQAPSDGLASELQVFVKDRLAQFKYPRELHFLDELPKTATGKIQRFKLRELSRNELSKKK